MAWLQFVVRNRRGETLGNTFDMHIGPVADDNVYRSIQLFETGVLDADETVKRLKTEVLQDQWTFHTKKNTVLCSFYGMMIWDRNDLPQSCPTSAPILLG